MKDLVIAIPKGRILKQLTPFFGKVNIVPEEAFFDDKARQLQFGTNHAHISIIRVRSFDVATFVAFGAAHMGVCGNDVLAEFDYTGIYAPVDLKIGACRLSIAQPNDTQQDMNPATWSHMRIATKYPHLTQKYFESQGIGTEIIKLNGAMELAPNLGLCHRIVDLVSTGSTLKQNNLLEMETIMHITSRLIVNRTAYKTRNREIQFWIDAFADCVES